MTINKSKQQKEKTENNLSDKQIRYFIQMLDIKEENNMTRIYFAITISNPLNQNNNKK
jgi:hypothetical protein